MQLQDGIEDIVDVHNANPKKRAWPRKATLFDPGGKENSVFPDPDKASVPYRIGEMPGSWNTGSWPGKKCVCGG